MNGSENYPGFEYMEGVRSLISGNGSDRRVKADFEAFYRSSEEDTTLLEVVPDESTVYEFFSRAGNVARSYGLTDKQSDRVFEDIRNALNHDRPRSELFLDFFSRPLGQNTVYGVPESELYNEFNP